MSAKKAKDLLRLKASIRTLQKYFKIRLGKKYSRVFCEQKKKN
jgi:hypothetical protein